MTPQAPYVSLSVPIDGTSSVDEAGRQTSALAAALGLDGSARDRAARVVAEAGANILRHAGHGEILLGRGALDGPARLEVLALDRGAGIANVAQASQDGYSTSGSPGLGLGIMARLSTFFEISSAPGKGTALLARVGPAAPQRSPAQPVAASLEWGAVCVPKRDEQVCGDAWFVKSGEHRNTILIVDGLGHGPAAFDAAQQVLSAFEKLDGERPEAKLKSLHESMRAANVSRGAVVAVVEIDWRQRQLRNAGAGNIVGTLVPVQGPARSLVSLSGTVGHQVARFQEFTHTWPDDGLLILHSDGLSEKWQLGDYPGLSRKDPSLVAGVLYRDFASRKDDVVVLVARERAQGTGEQGGRAT